MAHMYPPEIKEDTESWAERELFNVIQEELSGQWFVCHSLGLAFHPSKPWAEIDFVLIGPLGFFCLEVKGGTVIRSGGIWFFGQDSKKEGPFDQVGSARAALYKHLIPTLPWLRDVVSGYGVAMPDFPFTQTGPDIQPRVLYDQRDRSRPFSAYVRRLSDYWTERLESQMKGPVSLLTEAQCSSLLAAIRGDFDLRPSLATRVGVADKEMLRLTQEQYRRLDELADNERVLVRGGAGSGKTLLAVEEARRAARLAANRARSGAGTPDRVLFCCRSERLAQYVGAALKDCPNVDVRALHSLMKELVRRAGLQDRLPRAEETDLLEVFYPQVAIEALFEMDEVQQYGMLIVDEAQDLLRDMYLDFFDSVLRNGLDRGTWRIFLDPYQDVFAGIEPKGIRRLNDTHPVQLRLSVNCRNTRPVAVAYGLLSGIVPGETLQVEGPEVEHFWYRDLSHAAKLTAECIKKLIGEGIAAKDIVLLSPRPRDNTWLRNGLPAGTPAVLADYTDPSVPPPANTVRFTTVGSFKGLESEAVLLIGCEDLDDPETARTVYVGASRAKAYLALLLAEVDRDAYERRAAEYGRRLREQRTQQGT